jgi:putative tricarboxylic transport membrane protein
MSLKGETVKAFGIGIVASFIGTFFSAAIALFASKYIAVLAIKMGPWEYFSLCLCAIMLVVSLSKGAIAKGLASACIGMLIASTGFAPIDAVRRFTFGINNIAGGVDMVALMMGVFAVRQIMVDFAKGSLILPPVVTKKIHGMGITFSEIKNNVVCIIRSFFIGLGIGFLPGMGGAIGNVIAYAKAKDAHPRPEEFGKGCSTGVWATETSNNAAIGGAIIPMVSLGIPGDSTTAILLGALTIHGIEPGPLLFRNHPLFVYVLFAAVLVSAIVVLLIQFFSMRLFPYLLRIPPYWMYPVLLVFCFIGAYSSSSTIFNCGLLLFIGVLGVLMAAAELPATPLLLTYVLSKMLETNLRRGFNFSQRGGIEFLTRPVSLFLLLFAAGSLFMPIIRNHYSKKKKTAVS